MTSTVAWEQLWLPLWPRATDDFTEGVYRMSRRAALEKRHIEANPDHVCNLLAVDSDHSDAALRALSAAGHHPMPNFIVENPHNGHIHSIWACETPFLRTEYGSRKTLAYAAAVTEGLRRAVDGDKSYSGLMTKNPTHQAWITHTPRTSLYTLDELASELGDLMPPRTWRQTKARRANPVGLGRNCTLFETARHWAYREVRNHWGDPSGLGAAIFDHAALLNLEFSEPLPVSEVRAIANSITRWITTKSRLWADGPVVYEATFSTIQSYRGRKSGLLRSQASAESAESIRSEIEGFAF